MKKFLMTLLTSSFLLVGCSTQIANLKPNAPMTPTYENSESFFVFGIGQERIVNAVKICGNEDKIAKVESYISPSNVLYSLITLGIYTPRVSRVYCEK